MSNEFYGHKAGLGFAGEGQCAGRTNNRLECGFFTFWLICLVLKDVVLSLQMFVSQHCSERSQRLDFMAMQFGFCFLAQIGFDN